MYWSSSDAARFVRVNVKRSAIDSESGVSVGFKAKELSMKKTMVCAAVTMSVLIYMGPVCAFAQSAAVAGGQRFDNSAMASASAYWTEERLQNAQPMPLLDVSGEVPSAPTTANSGGGSSPGGPPSLSLTPPRVLRAAANTTVNVNPLSVTYSYPYPFTRYFVYSPLYDGINNDLYPYSTIGRLFFTLGGVDHSCSASVAHPHTLITARHCIFNYVAPSGGQFATNVVFYPNWQNGVNPLMGAWPARWLYTWISNAPNYNYDIGFIQLFDDDRVGCGGSLGANPIEAYTGWLGWEWGFDYTRKHWDAIGYPADPPFDGRWMTESESSTGDLNVFGFTDTIEIGSDQTGGASGGPWLLYFSPGGGAYVNGVNSFKFTSPDHSNAMNSPQFWQYNYANLRDQALALPCP
jgi:V8-like Glu-specific endopeptidase